MEASVASNTFAVHGLGLFKDMAQLLPGILTQLGPEALTELKKMADLFTEQQKQQKVVAEDDDDVPDLVESFEQPEEAK